MNKCFVCKKEFIPKAGSKGKYCSYVCMNLGKIKGTYKKCAICKNKIWVTPSINKKCCSVKCYGKLKRKRGDKVVWTVEMRSRMSKKYKGAGNPMFGIECWNKGKKRPEMSGKKHPLWKRGYWFNKDGYKVLESVYTKGRRILEHRKIMEDFIGRPLLIKELVHHINGNKLDNRIENLQIVSRKEHPLLHKRLQHSRSDEDSEQVRLRPVDDL